MAKGSELDIEVVAAVLVEAPFTTDDAVCKKYGISVRSLQRYRQRLLTDPRLADLVATKKDVFDSAWAQTFPKALSTSIRVTGEMIAAIAADPQMLKNPIALEKVAGAMKLLTEAYYTSKWFDAQLRKQSSEADGLSVPGDTDDEASDYAN
jgi:hypothetical protein